MKRFTVQLLGIVAILAIYGMADATVTANSVVTAQTPNRIAYQLGATGSCTGSGTPYPCCTGSGAGCVAGTQYTIYTAGSNGSKCSALWMNTSDNATHAITFEILTSTVTTKGPGTLVTTVGSGGSGTFSLAQAVLNPTGWPGLPVDSDGNPYISLNNGDTLTASFATTITSGDVVNFGGSCSDF